MQRERLLEVESSIEYEKKAMLSSAEYYCFIRNFFAPQSKMIVQINHYYDTHTYEFNDIDTTCRIREKNGNFKATIKKHCKGYENRSIEKSVEAKNQYDTTLFADMDVRYQGNLTTIRKELALTPELKIVFDINLYLDVIDYELEIEFGGYDDWIVQNEIYGLADLLLEEKLITCASDFYKRFNNSKSKSKRFFERKRDLYK